MFDPIVVFQTWQEKEAGKVVLYTTTMGIVRDTYQRCLQVRQILRTHLVKYVERDVFMSREVQKEIRERLGGDTISVPQLFVEGNLIGVSFRFYNYYSFFFYRTLIIYLRVLYNVFAAHVHNTIIQ
jgi:glutaredoxin-related protein